jgi:hypothetical protein
MNRLRPIAVFTLGTMAVLSGCAPAALTALGIGGSAAAHHTLSGVTYKTFTAPMPRLHLASLDALNRMDIRIGTMWQQDGNQVVTARANDREIEIVLEPISSSTTRMRVIARNSGVFFDHATAAEIIQQTERMLAKP